MHSHALARTSVCSLARFSDNFSLPLIPGACSALTRYARNHGAQTVEKCGVTGIGVAEDELGVKRIRHVDTTAGRIRTNCVVNATGVWAPYIGAMAGVSVPLVAMHHSYIVTEKIDGGGH